MKMTIGREWSNDICTISALKIDGETAFFTLEDVVREIDGRIVAEWKVPGKTAIPRGTYKVEITYSPRFKRHMPELMEVKGFAGVRIHSGNVAQHTEGCILVGMSKGPDCIYESKKAYEALYDQIAGAIERGESITLEVA
jgi:hypothetical protein